MYALVIDNAIVAVRNPGRLETKLFDGATLGPPPSGWTPELAALCGFLPVVKVARPTPSGPDRTHDRSVVLVAGTPTQTWTERDMTVEEVTDRDDRAAEAAADLASRNQMRQVVKSAEPGNLAEAIQQIQGLKRLVRRVLMKQVGIDEANE